MIRTTLPLALCGFISIVIPAVSQTRSAKPDADSPYGGVAIKPGSLHGPGTPAASGACPGTDPCVLTGQNNRQRTSTNANELNLAGMTSKSAFSNFGLAYIYPVTHPANGFSYEPVIAQPLYATSVSVPAAPVTMCGGTAKCNMLVVGTLSDWVYAFDTGTSPASGNTLWSINLSRAPGHCNPSTGGPFINNHEGEPGVQNLPYYGIVATPVIDIAPADATAFVVSACVDTPTSTATSWFLDAIDLTNGTIRSTVALADAGNFNPPNQIARASLLVTHPTTATTYVYVTFGDGVREIGAEIAATLRYTGAMFVFPFAYTSNTFGAALSPIFYTTCMKDTSICPSQNLFPPVYASLAPGYAEGGPAGGNACSLPNGAQAGNCSQGTNWAVNGGGIWMSSRGPASTSSANVYVASANGGFACGTTGEAQTSCTNAASGSYWAESAVQFPPGNAAAGVASGSYQSGLTASGDAGTQCLLTFAGGGATANGTALVTLPISANEPLIVASPGGPYTSAPISASASIPATNGAASCSGSSVAVATVIGPLIPHDFFSPNPERYTINRPGLDPDPAPYQNQELNRVDQDFGTGGAMIIPEPGGANFLASADKSGYLYLMPPASGEIATSSLGGFRPGDAGLNGAGLPYVTQTPFQASRHPQPGDANPVCTAVNATGKITDGAACDEIHELAWNNDLLFVFPAGESIEVFKGTYTAGPPAQYSVGTTPAVDPCDITCNCSKTAGCTAPPPFPQATAGSGGGAMALAADNATVTASCPIPACVTLWTIVPQANAAGSYTTGSLYSYDVASTPALTHTWDSLSPASHQCANPPVSAWFTTAFTEPSLADNQQAGASYGAVYVPTVCATTNTDGTKYPSCTKVPASNIASGVLVYTNCP